MPLRPGRAVAAPLAAALLAGAAQGAEVPPGPGPAEVPLAPAASSQAPAPAGPPPDEPAPEPPLLPRSPADIASGRPVRVEPEPGPRTWLDQGHALVGNLLGTALRIDRFFSDERELDPQRDQSFLRWRNDLRIATDDRRVAYRTTLLADLRFPGLNRWLERARLVIAGEADETAAPGGSPGSPSGLGPTIGRTAAELQYAMFETFHLKADVGAGIIFALPPGAATRFRLRYAEPVGELLLLRAAAATFLRSDLGVGELLQAEIEHRIASDALVRLTGSGTANHRERARGVQWASELAFIRAFGPRSAISLGAGLNGVTLPAERVDAYRVYARLRHDLFRQWIFFELEPEVSWPFVPSEPRSEVYGFTFRVEAQFQGDGRRDREAPRVLVGAEPEDPP